MANLKKQITTSKLSRLDDLLVLRGEANSKTQARALIMAGLVFHADTRLEKPGQKVNIGIEISVRQKPHPWVSRGGIKLEHGLEYFNIPIYNKVCMDVGSSTGGFTDVLLSKGAGKVYAIDSGTGQLDWKLRKLEKVVVHERTNARYLTSAHIPEPIDVITCDASFISLTKVLPTPLSFAKNGAYLVALIKPQFEAGREFVGKGGVIVDQKVHQSVCKKIFDWLASQPGWTPQGIEPSPITGPKGNREFLVAAQLLD